MATFAKVHAMWPGVPGNTLPDSPSGYTILWEHIEKRCQGRLAMAGYITRADQILDLLARIRRVSNYDTKKRDELGTAIWALGNGVLNDAQATALCRTLGALLTLDVEPGHVLEMDNSTKRVTWNASSSIKSLVEKVFPKRHNTPTGDISKKLTIEYLHNHHKVSIIWTDNLAKHLQFRQDGDEKTIAVYRHRVLLTGGAMAAASTATSNPHFLLPEDLIKETRDTLNILFPRDGSRTKRFLKSHDLAIANFYDLGGYEATRALADYKYWGAEMARLSQLADLPPTGFASVLPGRDLSNFKESATFWLAVVFVAALTVASIVLGAFSYYIGKKQLDLAQVSYDLSLALACLEHNSTDLPRFCP